MVRDIFTNMPMWVSRWLGGYCGALLQAQVLAHSMGWKASLADIAPLVKGVWQELGLTLDHNIRIVDGQGNYIPLAVWGDGRVT